MSRHKIFDIPKTCENCLFFSQHYEIVSGKYLNPVNSGTCKKDDKNNNIILPNTPACKKWCEFKDISWLTTDFGYANIVRNIKVLAMIVDAQEERAKKMSDNLKSTLN